MTVSTSRTSPLTQVPPTGLKGRKHTGNRRPTVSGSSPKGNGASSVKTLRGDQLEQLILSSEQRVREWEPNLNGTCPLFAPALALITCEAFTAVMGGRGQIADGEVDMTKAVRAAKTKSLALGASRLRFEPDKLLLQAKPGQRIILWEEGDKYERLETFELTAIAIALRSGWSIRPKALPFEACAPVGTEKRKRESAQKRANATRTGFMKAYANMSHAV